MDFWKYLHPLLRTDNDTRYGTANYAVLQSISDSLSDAERDTIAKKVQLNFATATGSYLDEWGSWFGVGRRADESDDDYRERIKYYLLMPRSTIAGIIAGIQYYLEDTDATISIYEPWKNIFYTNNSVLNGEDHLEGYYYRYAVMDVHIDRPMSQALHDAIMAFKPAGVKFYVTIDQNLMGDKPQVLANLSGLQSNLMDFEKGFWYHHQVPITVGDFDRTQSPVKPTDYFKTNHSKSNGEDVLAGSPNHNKVYWNDATINGEKITSIQRAAISSLNNSYITLQPGKTTTINFSLLNELANNYAGLINFFAKKDGKENGTMHEKVKSFLDKRVNLYVYSVYTGSIKGTPNGFNQIQDKDWIKDTDTDIYGTQNIVVDKTTNLYYIGICLDVNYPDKPFTGLGVSLKSDISVETSGTTNSIAGQGNADGIYAL